MRMGCQMCWAYQVIAPNRWIYPSCIDVSGSEFSKVLVSRSLLVCRFSTWQHRAVLLLLVQAAYGLSIPRALSHGMMCAVCAERRDGKDANESARRTSFLLSIALDYQYLRRACQSLHLSRNSPMIVQPQLIPQPLDSSLRWVSYIRQELAVIVLGPVGHVIVATHRDPLRFLVFAAGDFVAELLQ